MRGLLFLFMLLLLLILNSCYLIIAASDKNGCKSCRLLVRSFIEGLDQTQKFHFGGGNTDWEERNLGRFLTR